MIVQPDKQANVETLVLVMDAARDVGVDVSLAADEVYVMTLSVRYITGLLVGGFVALVLLWLMQYLIATGEGVLDPRNTLRFIDFVRVEKDDYVPSRKRKPEPPPKPEVQPPVVPQRQSEQQDLTVVSIYVPPLSTGGRAIDIPGSRVVKSDGGHLPIVKVAPVYPRLAQQRGLEGTCTVEYTVTTMGTVENPTVVECSSALFERASLAAALKFKYKPRVVDGQAISVPGVKNQFTFVLDQ